VEDIAFVFENTKYINVILHIKDTRKTKKLDDETEIINDNYNNYDIVNIKIRNSGDFGVEKKFTFHTKSPIKLFQPIQPNICNNADLDSPLSVSVYANAISTLMAIDNVYDSLNNEIQLGRKRIIADVDQYTEVDEKGNKVSTFDPNDALIYSIPARDTKVGEAQKQLLEDISGQLRINDIVAALNQQLSIYSSKVGFGENYYRFSDMQKGVTTATQVISENSTLYKTMRKHEILLEQSLKDMVLSLVYLNNTFTTNPTINLKGYEDIVVQFDDSIIEDTEAQKTSDRQDVNNGVMSKVEYRMKYYGEDEETAVKSILKTNVDIITHKAEQLTTLLNDGYITPTAFVKLVYGEYGQYIEGFNEQELIAKVEESVVNNKPIPSPFDEADLMDEE
jgi:A118 family predicted phage portal protein